ncbi:hypothetical protein, partial [Acidithiobacillus caldus]|uniref:hypothetical protein n=1 Tax=Acidithiobacillus caldus TaxID=33059 RepID=UPI001C06BD0B
VQILPGPPYKTGSYMILDHHLSIWALAVCSDLGADGCLSAHADLHREYRTHTLTFGGTRM